MSRATRKDYEIRHFTGGAGPKKCPKLSEADGYLIECNKMLKEFKRGPGKIDDIRVSEQNVPYLELFWCKTYLAINFTPF